MLDTSNQIILEILSWIGFAILAVISTLCIATGLFYLAELVEEYTAYSRKVLTYVVMGVAGLIFIVGAFSTIPWTITLVGLLANAFYYSLLDKFPFFNFIGVPFIGSVVVLIAHHWLTMSHFSDVWYPFDQVTSYFVVLVWMVPFFLFISLSANEQVLPTMGQPSQENPGPKHKGGVLAVLNLVKDKLDSLIPGRGKNL